MKTEPEWKDNPGTGVCPVPVVHDTEVFFKNGKTKRDTNPEGWCWRKVNNSLKENSEGQLPLPKGRGL